MHKLYRELVIILGLIPRWILYFLSGLFPRDRRLWLFGAYGESFSDNAKYLFLHAAAHVPEVRAVWISSSRETLNRIRALGHEAVVRRSFKGAWLLLRAKYYFYTFYPSDVGFYTSRGATLVNLWHGTPIKKIGFDIDTGPLAPIYMKPTWRDRWIEYPAYHARPAFVLSPSDYVSDYGLRTAFRVPAGGCLALGYPRLEVLFQDRAAVRQRVEQLGESELAELLGRLAGFKRVVLYLPTFRDSGVDCLAAGGLDFQALDELCAEFDAAVVIKLHLGAVKSEAVERIQHARRVFLAAKALDVYPLMACADILVSDYSSVMFEFMLTGRPVLLYAFDLEAYQKTSRSFYLPFEQMAVGEVVKTPVEFLAALRRLLAGPLRQNYSDEQVARFNRFRDGDASRRICEYFTKGNGTLR